MIQNRLKMSRSRVYTHKQHTKGEQFSTWQAKLDCTKSTYLIIKVTWKGSPWQSPIYLYDRAPKSSLVKESGRLVSAMNYNSVFYKLETFICPRASALQKGAPL